MFLLNYFKGEIMTYDDVIKYFGNAYKVSKTGHFSKTTAYAWKKNGFIPIRTQMKLEEITGGALKADLMHCKTIYEI